jgi:hypothetical protein
MAETTPSTVQSPFTSSEEGTPVQKYLTLISAYDNEFKKWEARTTKLIKRYRDDNRTQSQNDNTAKFNILWSNVQTLLPAVYAKLPKADVTRRFGDNDQVGRVAALIMERALDFEIEHYPDFRATMTHAVEDRFLGGRGVAWVRYEPHVRAQELGEPEDGLEVTSEVESENGEADDTDGMTPVSGIQDDTQAPDEVPEEIEYECAPVDYVHWKDFGHSVARTWDEVTCVWRWAYMTKDALVERFGEEKAKDIPLDSGPSNLNNNKDTGPKRDADKAKICELWDKATNKVYWISKSRPQFIDTKDDPLDLEGFFPCAKPLYATMTSDTLVPVPDFVLYQDQAMELDILSDRIDGLVKALKVMGVYDASQPALQRIMTEGNNNDLIPVDKWTAFSEKGGLKGSIDLIPIDMLAQALTVAYKAREDIKAQIYEITGISDIVRGVTAASETATAQQIKGQYAGLRLRSMQEEVALFASELIRLKAQVMGTKFQPQTLWAYSAANQMTQEDQQMIEPALKLLADKPLRNFRIEVAADSLVQIDENQHKKEAMEFIQAFGGFLQQAAPLAAQAPALAPLAIALMKMGVSAFKQARQIEGTLDKMMTDFQTAQSQPKPPPPPDPAMAKVQADAQADQARAQADMQIEQQKAQFQLQLDQQRMGIEAQGKAQQSQMDAALAQWQAKLDAAVKIMVAQIGAKAQVDAGALQTADQEVGRALA